MSESLVLNGFHESEPAREAKPWLMYQFPEQKRKIARLSFDQKMEWYATRNPQDMVFLGNNEEFKRFWKWSVMIPLRLKRFFYRVKSGQIFRRYEHISEMKVKRKGPERI